MELVGKENKGKRHKCFMCHKNKVSVPYQATMCSECLGGLYDRGIPWKQITRHVSGAFCESHGKYKWNVTTVGVWVCNDCLQEWIKGTKYYKRERDKRFKAAERYGITFGAPKNAEGNH